MATDLNPGARPGRPKDVGILPLLGGILALWAEAMIMLALMGGAGIYTVGWIIRRLLPKGESALRRAAGLLRTRQ
jgi:hypothetical protein